MSHNSKSTYSAPGNFSVSSLSPKLPRYGSSIQPRGFRKVHVGGPIRPIRFQEASRAKESAIVRYHSFSHGLDYGCSHGGFSKECPLNRKNDGLLSSSEKETMQLLNDRLASYLEKVRSLQQDNAQLERKIRDWYDKQHPQTLPDFNHYFGTVEELQKKILLSAAENARMARQVDNVRLAADDFRKKSEIEQKMRSFVELDVKTLHKELGQLKIETQDLEMLHQDLQHNLLYMKKNNEDTVNSLNTQLGARVSVEVEVPPAIDLTKLLSDIREQYEELMENNKIEAENWFLAKTKELSCEVQTESQYPQISKSNLIELKRTIQTQEIELQSQRSMKMALEDTLTETKNSYSSQLAQLQDLIHKMEDKLTNVRCKLGGQSREYKVLMDVTMHLEKEIATYRQLLDEQDIHVPRPPLPGPDGCQKGVKFFSVTEEVEQRKILSPKDNC